MSENSMITIMATINITTKNILPRMKMLQRTAGDF